MDAEQVVERIAAHVRHRRERAPAPPLAALPAESQVVFDLAFLEAAPDIYDVELPSPRPILGPPLRLVKQALRRLLAPVLGRQVEYNRTVARTMRHLKEQVAALARRQDDLQEALEAQAHELRALRTAHPPLPGGPAPGA
jgi:hypothetical protein